MPGEDRGVAVLRRARRSITKWGGCHRRRDQEMSAH
jgi:hypothetical protein